MPVPGAARESRSPVCPPRIPSCVLTAEEQTQGPEGDSRGPHLFYSPFICVFLSFPSGIQTLKTRTFKTNCNYGGD